MTGKLSGENRRKLLRNLALSTQTVIACGHAIRVTVADMLQDFDNIRAVSASDPHPCHLPSVSSDRAGSFCQRSEHFEG